jgi:hypothetical protein
MSNALSWKELIAKAEEAGASVKELKAGKYPDVEFTHVKVSPTQGGGERVGLRYVVRGGPEDGGSEWLNINVPKAGDKPGAAAIFLRTATKLGVEPEGTLEEAFSVVLGTHFSVELKRTRPDSRGGFWPDTTVFGPTAGSVSTPVSTPSEPLAAVPPIEDDDDDFEERPI